MSTPSLLELRGVSVAHRDPHTRKDMPRIKDLSLRLDAGQTCVVLGESGIGKSTLVYLLAGFIRRQERSRTGIVVKGDVLIDGRDQDTIPPERRDISLVMQNFSLFPHMTLNDNLSFPLRFAPGRPLTQAERVARVGMAARAARVDLDEWPQSITELSGGQKQRVAIAKMLLRQRRVAVLDEAFAGLDPVLRHELWDMCITETRKLNGCVVFVTHELYWGKQADVLLVFEAEGHLGQQQPLVFAGRNGVSAWDEMVSHGRKLQQLSPLGDKSYIRDIVYLDDKLHREVSIVPENVRGGPCIFGHTRFTPREVLDDLEVRATLETAVSQILRDLSVTESVVGDLLRQVWHTTESEAQDAFEDRLRSTIAGRVASDSLAAALVRRGRRILEQVAGHVLGPCVVDGGCGDGQVGHALKERGFQVSLVDVMNYLAPPVDLPVTLYAGYGPLPTDIPTADTTLLLTVLHHADDPLEVFNRFAERTRGRIVIIESVCGIDKDTRMPSPLTQLTAVGQRKYATFIDWFYNRILHDGVPVPYNFGSPAEWRTAFRDSGWKVISEEDLGIDQPIVPEHHVLFVLERDGVS